MSDELNESQKEAISELRIAMENLFGAFMKVDENDMQISEALEAIGMDIPLFVKPAINQLSGKLKEMREEADQQALEV
jgi:hypothetical protein